MLFMDGSTTDTAKAAATAASAALPPLRSICAPASAATRLRGHHHRATRSHHLAIARRRRPVRGKESSAHAAHPEQSRQSHDLPAAHVPSILLANPSIRTAPISLKVLEHERGSRRKVPAPQRKARARLDPSCDRHHTAGRAAVAPGRAENPGCETPSATPAAPSHPSMASLYPNRPSSSPDLDVVERLVSEVLPRLCVLLAPPVADPPRQVQGARPERMPQFGHHLPVSLAVAERDHVGVDIEVADRELEAGPNGEGHCRTQPLQPARRATRSLVSPIPAGGAPPPPHRRSGGGGGRTGSTGRPPGRDPWPWSGTTRS